jgi:hypothetical protein
MAEVKAEFEFAECSRGLNLTPNKPLLRCPFWYGKMDTRKEPKLAGLSLPAAPIIHASLLLLSLMSLSSLASPRLLLRP